MMHNNDQPNRRTKGFTPFIAIVTAALLFLVSSVATVFAGGAKTPLKFGVYPMLEVTKVVRNFTPLAKYLEDRLGRPVEIVVSDDYNDHVAKTARYEYDFSYIGPASYGTLVKMSGSLPILARLETNGSPTFKGAIVTRKETTLSSLKELAGKRFAFSDKGSTMGYLVPRHMLWKKGVKLEDFSSCEFLPNQEDVALGVLAGLFDAGAVREQVFRQYEDRGLKVIAWSPSFSEHLIVASPRLPGTVRSAIKKALLSLAKAPGGAEILKGMQRSATGFVPGAEKDYMNIIKIMSDLAKLDKKQ